MSVLECRRTPEVEERPERGHRVPLAEVAEVFEGRPQYVRCGRDDWGDMRYRATAQAESGRWLSVVFVREAPYGARVLTARDATPDERRAARR